MNMINKRSDKLNSAITSTSGGSTGGSANDNMKVFFVVEGRLTYSTCD